MSSCCPSKPPKPDVKTKHSGCCPSDSDSPQQRWCIDWLLAVTGVLVLILYLLHGVSTDLPQWLKTASHGVVELVHTMWWGVLLAAVFVGLLAKIPQPFVMAILGRPGSKRGIARATLAGVLMDLCSHGILMVGMKLYEKGASLGQVMAFLIASPWNSLSLTLILIALIGLKWTVLFIVLSMLLALITGYLFDRLVSVGALPANPHDFGAAANPDFQFWPEAKAGLVKVQFNADFWRDFAEESAAGSRIVVRWLLVGILLAAALRAFVSVDMFQEYFGPTALGLAMTLVAATIIEVCSEGSTPIAADIYNRAQAPGNSFAFLITGVATVYTEVMVLKDTTKSWKIALFLPLLLVPQVVVLAVIINAGFLV